MASPTKHTKLKVISGYSLLFLLSILLTILIYKQITRLILSEETTSRADQKLFLIGSIITGLYEAEAHSNAFVQTGGQRYFRNYLSLMESTEENIDSLKTQTNRLEQLLRLDSISLLLEEKIKNLQDLVQVKSSLAPADFYNKAIASIESNKDSLMEAVNIRKRFITTLDSSYVKSEKKKRFRLFGKNEPDSVLKVSISHHTIIDTLNNQGSVQNTDTVVNILKNAWENMQKQTEDINQQINRKEYALIQKSTYITDQLKRILGEYEKEEINNSFVKQQKREQVITTMIRIFAWVAIAAFLLVIFFTFFILRDLSRSQRYRRELENANSYADQLLKSREKMILTVTHDIKSPLSSVIGYIELLNRTPINERQRYFLKNMQGSSEHILKLVGNLLDLSKLENHKMAVEEIVFNPSQLFHEIADNFFPSATAKNLELKVAIEESLNTDFKGDALRIRQIITNILSNAVKYTQQGEISFSAAWSEADTRLSVRIADTGTGMTEEEQKLIFQEFTRLTTHATIEGTGLGLTITLKLIQLLGGEIQLNSSPGQGSCFTILLPLKKIIVSGESTTPIPASTVALSPLKILLVDDDPLQLEMTAAVLENNGLCPTTTTHPKEVATLLRSENYDLIFSDIQMPEMSGFELVRQIRQLPLPFAATLPVVALSADSGKQKDDYLQAGFTAYLAKPFSSIRLLQLIRELTGQSPTETLPSSSRKIDFLPATEGYTLKNILEFADHDFVALQQILSSFTTETDKHLQLLQQYEKSHQKEAIARLAHKMLPMFRQLETAEIVALLEQLEHTDFNTTSPQKLQTILQEIHQRIHHLLEKLSVCF